MSSLDPRWLDREQTARYLCATEGGLSRMVKAGRVPGPSYHLGVRSPRWDRYALDAVMTGGIASTHSTEAASAVDALCDEIVSNGRRANRQKAAR